MVAFRSLLFLIASLAASLNAKSSSGDSVLVIVEPKQQDNHSLFFDGLKGTPETPSQGDLLTQYPQSKDMNLHSVHQKPKHPL